MMNEEAKEMYYIAKRNMNKYIKCPNDYYFKIVGFRYYTKKVKGLIVRFDDDNIGANYDNIKNYWLGNKKIFLNKHDKGKYYYDWIIYPLEVGYKIINNKDDE